MDTFCNSGSEVRSSCKRIEWAKGGIRGRPFPTARRCCCSVLHCRKVLLQLSEGCVPSRDAEEGSGEADLAFDQGEGELLFGVGIVLVGNVEDGVAAEMLERVHREQEVA